LLKSVTAFFEASSHITFLGILGIILVVVAWSCYHFIPKKNVKYSMMGLAAIVVFAGAILYILGPGSASPQSVTGNCNATATGTGNSVSTNCNASGNPITPTEKK
jgi:hypothetical protein